MVFFFLSFFFCFFFSFFLTLSTFSSSLFLRLFLTSSPRLARNFHPLFFMNKKTKKKKNR